MLEVMKAGSTDLSSPGGDHGGILLNCWNNSSPLIKELERTVSFAERKCGDLMQQLNFYKEYYQKWAQVERVGHFCNKKKVKKSCKNPSDFGSSSENELDKANQYFYKKIKSKITEMNNQITNANRKIHSQNDSPCHLQTGEPVPSFEVKEDAREAQDSPSLMFENKTCKSEPMMTSCDADTGSTKVTAKQSSKSVPSRIKASKILKKDTTPSKKRFASLQRFKIRSKSLPQGVKRKFGFGGFFEVFEADPKNGLKSSSKSRTSLRADSSKSGKSRKSRTRLVETRRSTPKGSRYRITKSKSDIRECLRKAKCEFESKKTENSWKKSSAPKPTAKEVNTCTAVVPSGCITDLVKASEPSLSDNLKNLIAKPTSLLPFLRNPIPFIPCSSTSKSFNLGLNVQQVLSLIKHKRHSVTLQAVVRSSMQAARSITEPTVNTLFISQTTTSHSHVTSAICPAREGSEHSFSIVTENRSKCGLLKQVQSMRSRETEEKVNSSRVEVCKPERPEDVWVVEQPDASSREVRNSRSRCTCFPSKHCVEYNKVLRQYTGWRLPTESPSPYLCTKSKLYALPLVENTGFSDTENDGRTEVMKVHNDLLNLTRKYSMLQQQISQNSLEDYEANAELDAMESELAIREIEFRDILNFYNQLVVLKGNLKSLRSQIGHGGSAAAPAAAPAAARQPECERPKKSPLRPTPSMALAKVLKKIQGLQDKIKLIGAP